MVTKLIDVLRLRKGLEKHQNTLYDHPLTCGNDSRHEVLQSSVSVDSNGLVVKLRCVNCNWVQNVPEHITSRYIKSKEEGYKGVGDFQKTVSVLRSHGMGVTVENYINGIQVATVQGDELMGGFSRKMKSVLLDEEEMDIVKELLSGQACGYERETYYFHCCDAKSIIEKIDKVLKDTEDE